ncbi:MAG: hypothetical protein CMJ64_29530 [Planctomycetaceae bacterium]|nr:hypothetical protein [Planctomycetaceae bacterium]
MKKERQYGRFALHPGCATVLVLASLVSTLHGQEPLGQQQQPLPVDQYADYLDQSLQPAPEVETWLGPNGSEYGYGRGFFIADSGREGLDDASFPFLIQINARLQVRAVGFADRFPGHPSESATNSEEP